MSMQPSEGSSSRPKRNLSASLRDSARSPSRSKPPYHKQDMFTPSQSKLDAFEDKVMAYNNIQLKFQVSTTENDPRVRPDTWHAKPFHKIRKTWINDGQTMQVTGYVQSRGYNWLRLHLFQLHRSSGVKLISWRQPSDYLLRTYVNGETVPIEEQNVTKSFSQYGNNVGLDVHEEMTADGRKVRMLKLLPREIGNAQDDAQLASLPVDKIDDLGSLRLELHRCTLKTEEYVSRHDKRLEGDAPESDDEAEAEDRLRSHGHHPRLSEYIAWGRQKLLPKRETKLNARELIETVENLEPVPFLVFKAYYKNRDALVQCGVKRDIVDLTLSHEEKEAEEEAEDDEADTSKDEDVKPELYGLSPLPSEEEDIKPDTTSPSHRPRRRKSRLDPAVNPIEIEITPILPTSPRKRKRPVANDSGMEDMSPNLSSPRSQSRSLPQSPVASTSNAPNTPFANLHLRSSVAPGEDEEEAGEQVDWMDMARAATSDPAGLTDENRLKVIVHFEGRWRTNGGPVSSADHVTTPTEDLKSFKKRLRFGYRPKAFDFQYDDDGLINDLDSLYTWSHLKLAALSAKQPLHIWLQQKERVKRERVDRRVKNEEDVKPDIKPDIKPSVEQVAPVEQVVNVKVEQVVIQPVQVIQAQPAPDIPDIKPPCKPSPRSPVYYDDIL